MNERELFAEALSRVDRHDRAAFLDQACGGDPALRQRLGLLLESYERAAPLLECRPAEMLEVLGREAVAVEEDVTETVGTVIAGRYTLAEVIGEGGMGTVYLARQTEPVRREVALKLIKRGMDFWAVLARFDAERQALALMDHPHIARIYDAGTTDAGQPYFIMELVRGAAITRYCDDRRLSLGARLELFVSVCQAVAHAHGKGVIHRDLKPTNVLVTEVDGRPAPRVIDFGVAKAAGVSLTDLSISEGEVVGTVGYMSPEQANPGSADVDTRTDVYALGAILYELLVGCPPHSAARAENTSVAELLRAVRETEPPRPSTVVKDSHAGKDIAARRGIAPARLVTQLRDEIDWVVMKALEKDPARRYQSVAELAADVQRYLGNDAVQAVPPRLRYRLGKFLTRQRGPVAAVALVLTALLLGVAGTGWGVWKAEEARRAEAAQRAIARDNQQEAQAQKKRALAFRSSALEALRAATNEDMDTLITQRRSVGDTERAYIESVIRRWRALAVLEGDDDQERALGAEGHMLVGVLWGVLARHDDACAEYEKAAELCRGLAVPGPDHLRMKGTLHVFWGLSLLELARPDRARQELEAARTAWQTVARQRPDAAEDQRRLALCTAQFGHLCHQLGNWDEARREYEKARDALQRLSDRSPSAKLDYDLANVLHVLGQNLLVARSPVRALAELRRARALLEKLPPRWADLRSVRTLLAQVQSHLGSALQVLGKRAPALVEYRQAAATLHALVEQYSGMQDIRLKLATTRMNMGKLLAEMGKTDEALQAFEQARDTARPLEGQSPVTLQNQDIVASAHHQLGAFLYQLRKLDRARAELEQSLTLRRRLVAAAPATPALQRLLASTQVALGQVLLESNEAAKSLKPFSQATGYLTALVAKDPTDAEARHFLLLCHQGRATALERLGRHAEAMRDWGRAAEVSPEQHRLAFRGLRMLAYARAGQTASAVAEAERLLPRFASPSGGRTWGGIYQYTFACVYAVVAGQVSDRKQQYADRAMELLHQAVQAGFRDAGKLLSDEDLAAIRGREDFKKLLAGMRTG